MKVFLIASILGVALAAPNTQLKFRNLYKDPLVPITPTHTGRIVNGQIAEPHSIPYQVFMEVYSNIGAWYCGGSLIAENVVLTAGHCGYEGEHATITLGAQKPQTKENSQIVVSATNIVIHEQFDMDNILNDISLMILDAPVQLTDAIQVVQLPKDNSDNFVGKTARVSGWGLTNGDDYDLSDVLRYTENPILDNEVCGETFGPLPDYQLCMSGEGGHGSCNGDSGGPVTVDGVQVGIVSYGVVYCREGYPSFFTRTSSFLDWIASKTNQPIKFRNLYEDPLAPNKSTHKGRIINVEITKPHSIPYQAFVSVHSTHGTWYCGGSLIAEDWILSAGHCCYGATHATIVLGAQVSLTLEASQVEVESEVIVHKGFDRNRILNDIALIKLTTPVKLSDTIQIVAIPKDDSDTYAGKIARVSGWELTDLLSTSLSDKLSYSDNPILTNKECDVSSGPIPDYQLCVSGKDGHGICSGDSGGPLTVDGVQVGIVSYVVGQCEEGYPSYYTRVSSFLDWIAENSSPKI